MNVSNPRKPIGLKRMTVQRNAASKKKNIDNLISKAHVCILDLGHRCVTCIENIVTLLAFQIMEKLISISGFLC